MQKGIGIKHEDEWYKRWIKVMLSISLYMAVCREKKTLQDILRLSAKHKEKENKKQPYHSMPY